MHRVEDVTLKHSVPLGCKILLITTCWWPAFARLAQLLTEAGCEVGMICPTGHPARSIPGLKVFEQSAFRPMHVLPDAIRRFDPMFLIPGDERALRHLHRLHASGSARERQLIERSLGPPASYPVTTCRDKMLNVARQSGVKVPAGQAIDGEADLDAFLSGVAPPWILKLDGSWGGMGVTIAATGKAARAADRGLRRQPNFLRAAYQMLVYRDPYWLADWLRRRPPRISGQAFIKGRSGDLTMFCWDGQVSAALMAENVTSLGPHRPAAIVRLIDRPDFMAAATILARELKLTGFYGLDFIIEEATGEALLLEMNPRPTSLSNVSGELIGAMVSALAGTPCPASAGPPLDSLVAYFPLAWQADSDDETLAQAHQDIPWNQPALMAEMLRRRWPERRFLARFVDGVERKAVAFLKKSSAKDFY